MAEAKIMEGKVGAYSKNNGGIRIDDQWYNVSNKDKQIPEGGLNKGDTVKFKWSKGKDEKGRVGNRIRSVVKVTEKAPKYDNKKGGGKGGWKGRNNYDDPKKQECIVRQSCLGYAAEVVAAKMTGKSDAEEAAQEVVKIAEELFFPFAYAPYLSEGKAPQKASKAPDEEEEDFEDPEEDEEEGFDDPEDGDEEFDDDIPF